MRLIKVIVLLALSAVSAAAQEEDDKSFLEGWLQDALSGAGREVTITGFEGALSSNATLEELTVADAQGVWLRVQGASLVWSRAALLTGRLNVNELTVERVELTRLPESEQTVSPEDSQATQFSLPDLPVSVDVQELRAGAVILQEAVLGSAAELALDGQFRLADGAAQAQLDIRRTDRDDALTFTGGFSNETRVLAVDLDFTEAGGGLMSELLGVPDAPALRLTVEGEAPLSDFTARMALATDDVERFGGTVRIGAVEDAAAQAYSFGADLDGDLRVLASPDLRPFFGETAEIRVSGQTGAAGRLVLDEMRISTAALDLGGSLAIGAGGWPERFDLSGRIGGEGRVRLPFGGADAAIGAADFTATFDAARGETWQARVSARGFTSADMAFDSAEVTGQGILNRDARPAITAKLAFDLAGVAPADEALAEAIGPDPQGRVELAWQPEAPLDLRVLRVDSGDLRLDASAELENLADGFPVTGRADVRAGDLSRFAALAGRELGGAAEFSVEGSATLLGGAFDGTIEARTRELAVGVPRIAPLLRPASTLTVRARRDVTGTFLDSLDLRNETLSAQASGQFDPEAGNLSLAARLNDVSLVEPGLSGPATLDSEVSWDAGDRLRLSRLVAGLAGAELRATGFLVPDDPDLPAEGRVTLRAEDLGRFSALANRDLGGAIDATFEGSARLRADSFDGRLEAVMRDLRVGVAQVAPALRGRSTLSVTASKQGAATILDRFELRNDALRATASGRLDDTRGRLTLDAGLTDAALVEPRLSGAASLDTALDWDPANEELTVSRLVAALAQTELTASGTIRPNDAALPVAGEVAFTAPDLSRFAELARRPLAGRLDGTLSGQAELRGRSFDITGEVDGQSLRTGLAEIDRLLGGRLSLAADLAVDQDSVNVDYLRADSAQLRAEITGTGPDAPVSVMARLADVGLLAPGFDGPAEITGTLTPRGGRPDDMGVDLDATGPGGITARLSGRVLDLGAELDLSATGQAPLGLVNRFIAPRSVQGRANFDLSINGAPGLDAVSGRAEIVGARVALPTLNAALSDVGGTIALSSGRATTDIQGSAGAGGPFRVRGPITLSGAIPAELDIALQGLGVADPNLFRTSLDGLVTVRGPLTGGAVLGGEIILGRTELRVPSGGGAAGGPAADLAHVNAPAAVTATRRRAGLIKEAEAGNPVSFPLDLTIRAPNRIFVRGRGLDAELGGELDVAGTTADVRASGLFELVRGRIDVLGQRITLTEGTVTLRGTLDPFLRFVAETEADDVLVRIILEGFASSPSVSFEAEPDMPQEEALAQLLFGRSLDEISAFQAAELVAAVATLSGQRGGGFQGGLRSALGLSNLDVTSTAEGATQFEAGAYLSDNIYSSVTADTDGNQEINLNLDVSDEVTVKGSTGTDGDTGLGIFFEKDY